eukprot:scaffold9_cov97-Isochrysis_galbana.AAC.6
MHTKHVGQLGLGRDATHHWNEAAGLQAAVRSQHRAQAPAGEGGVAGFKRAQPARLKIVPPAAQNSVAGGDSEQAQSERFKTAHSVRLEIAPAAGRGCDSARGARYVAPSPWPRRRDRTA